MTPLVELFNVEFHAGPLALLKDFNLTLPERGCTVFMGPAGSGKSTILKLIAGLLVPEKGKVFFRGKDWDAINENEAAGIRVKTGFVFQSAALWANKNVYQNIELPVMFHNPKIEREKVDLLIAKACERVGYHEDLQDRPAQLSLGEQKLVSFARAIALDPEVLFLDDPIAGLDAQGKEKILNIILEYKRAGRSVLLVTQDPSITAEVADYLVLIKAGKVLLQGAFSEVVQNQDPQVVKILTPVLSQAATYSNQILDLLSESE